MTCLVPTDKILEGFRKSQDVDRVKSFYSMSREQLWLECAGQLTTVIEQVMKFGNMITGFLKLSQHNQGILLKAGLLIRHLMESFKHI